MSNTVRRSRGDADGILTAGRVRSGIQAYHNEAKPRAKGENQRVCIALPVMAALLFSSGDRPAGLPEISSGRKGHACGQGDQGLDLRLLHCVAPVGVRRAASCPSRSRKDLERPGRETEKEDHMITLITMHELEGFTAHELGALHQLLTAKLSETAPDTAEHGNIRASLENVSRALAYARRVKVSPSP